MRSLTRSRIKIIFFPDVIEQFTQKYQQEIRTAKQSAIDLQTELNLSPDEARQVVWLNALAMERQVYNKLDDEDFISQPVSNRLTLMMNLKLDAVGAGQILPKLPPVESWDIRLYSWLIKLFNGTWTEKVQADLTAAQYEYLTFIAYSHQQVSMQLKSLVAERGIFRTFVEDCAYYTITRKLVNKYSLDLKLQYRGQTVARCRPLASQSLYRQKFWTELVKLLNMKQSNVWQSLEQLVKLWQ